MVITQVVLRIAVGAIQTVEVLIQVVQVLLVAALLVEVVVEVNFTLKHFFKKHV
jgi:hypothetical protein